MEFIVLGLSLGATYALIAIGIVLIYSVFRVYQLAQAAFTVFLAYVFLELYRTTGNSLAWAAVVTVATACVLSLVMSRLVFEPLAGRHFPTLVATFGLTIIFEAVSSTYFFNGNAVSFPAQLRPSGSFTLAGAQVTVTQAVVFLTAVAALLVVEVFIQYTRTGLQIRALADDTTGAALCGTNVLRTVRIVFVIAGAAAALAGVLIGMRSSTLNADLAPGLFIKGIAAALVAGGSSFRGAVLAAFVIAIAESLSIGYLSSAFSSAIAFGVVLVMLLIRPNGLFGHRELARA